MRLKKDIDRYALWKTWISYKELRVFAAAIDNVKDRQLFENAILMLYWSIRVIWAISIIGIFYSLLS